MTEDSYREAQKVMAKARGLRFAIIQAKANVSKWTRIEDYCRIEKQEAKRESASRNLQKALTRLEEVSSKFSALSFSEIDSPIKKVSDCIHGYKSIHDCPESDMCNLCKVAKP